MKQRNLIRRLTAALVSGAMALSLCAPALAAADEPAATLQPGTYPEGSIAVVYKDKENPIVVKENTDDILGDGTLAYKDGVLCSEKPVQSLYIDVNPEKTVDIRITTEEGAAAPGVLNIVNAHDVFLSGKVWGCPRSGRSLRRLHRQSDRAEHFPKQPCGQGSALREPVGCRNGAARGR